MTQKTISLSESAYNMLKKEKRKGESFSKVIERLILKEDNPWLLSRGKFDPELFDGLETDIRRLREFNLTGSEKDE